MAIAGYGLGQHHLPIAQCSVCVCVCVCVCVLVTKAEREQLSTARCMVPPPLPGRVCRPCVEDPRDDHGSVRYHVVLTEDVERWQVDERNSTLRVNQWDIGCPRHQIVNIDLNSGFLVLNWVFTDGPTKGFVIPENNPFTSFCRTFCFFISC